MLAVLVSVTLTSYAHAENSTVEVPFDSHGQSCWFNELEVEYHCTWQGINEVVTEEEIIQYQQVMKERQETIDNIITEHIKKPTLTYREKQLDRYEEIYERLLEIENPSAHEREYISLLENLAECRSGYGQSKGIFEDRWFPISHTWINDGEAWMKSFDYRGLEAELHKNIEECKAVRTVLNPVTLGVWYESRAIADEYDKNIYHGDRAKDVPVWTQERVNSQSNQQLPKDVDVCEFDDRYSEHTKRYFGCNETIVGETINPKGFIEYSNDIEDRWIQYQEDGGKAQTKELMAKVIAEKLKELRESLKQQQKLLDDLD